MRPVLDRDPARSLSLKTAESTDQRPDVARWEALRELHLQVLTKFPHHGFTQKIGIEFPAFCQLDDSLSSFYRQDFLDRQVEELREPFRMRG
jgi:hypothetical protein